ncbi:oligopeptidase F [Alicyclobacillus sacchari]|uniref:Oligopeptidase F n=1 Tax=Alicyclobacillus sacchari TaxID=392010 RepID=A0A4R8LTS7_9BACL|nr:M3 family metallopeptidase [Alicyclobacillus sacchari]TDY51119.1 oligopeptidase F [Alicyclobacillus sacchari]
MSLRSRSDVPELETWDLRPLFADVEAWEATVERIRTLAEQLIQRTSAESWADPEELAACLRLHDELRRLCMDVERYAMSRFAEDATNNEAQTLIGKARLASQRCGEASEHLRAAIRRLPASTLAAWRQHAEIAAYATYLRRLEEERAHTLHDDAERALAALAGSVGVPSGVYEAATGADMRFRTAHDSSGHEVAITPFALLMNIETSADTKLRHEAYHSVIDGLRPYQHTLARALAGKIQGDVAAARLRKYKSVFHMLQMADMGGTISANQVDPEHYFMVQDVMFNELAPHMRRYMRLRKRVLGLERPLLCDTKAPLVPLSGAAMSFTQARSLILDAARPLGSVYSEMLERAFRERWIYWARNAGNWNGAFCGESSVHPYVFSPFGGGMYDVFVLGHELGHAVHLSLACASELPTNLAFSCLFIETPSTLMEHMIANRLIATAADSMRRAQVRMMQMFTFHHDFVTHQTEAEILRRLYRLADQGEPLSTEVFRQTSRQVLAEFWGGEIDLDEGADLYWMRQPHYYMGLYPYTYAVGLTASTILAERLAAGETALVDDWIRVLSHGAGKSPLELFRAVGLDMDTPEPYRQAIRHVGAIIDELEAVFADA